MNLFALILRMCDDLDDLDETKKKVDFEIAKLRSLDSQTFGRYLSASINKDRFGNNSETDTLIS